MANPFLGEIRFFPFNFAPTGWALCQGQLLLISQNTALFSLLGTTYGGDGRSTFALPDLRGRAAMGFGNGPGLTPRVQGSVGGEETVALTTGSMPPHTHLVSAGGQAMARNAAGDSQSPVGNVPAIESAGVTATYATGALTSSMRAGMVAFSGTATAAATGSGTAHENRQPFLVLNLCIALQGVFPARS